MPRLYGLQEELILEDKVATIAAGGKIDVKDYMHTNLCVIGSDTASFTVKIKGSDQDDVDFSAAASKLNRWAYIEVVDLGDRTAIKKGADGVVVSADGVKIYTVNTDGLSKLTAEISSFTTGKASVYSRKYNNY
jgi:hypothetical protein